MGNYNKVFTRIYTLLAGLADTLTGLGLIWLPSQTLQLMGVDPSAHQLALIRFIGAFVFATGSLYVWAFIIHKVMNKWIHIRVTWFVTAWIRICVAAVTLSMIVSGDIVCAWLPVPLTDGILAGLQLFWIFTRRFPRDE